MDVSNDMSKLSLNRSSNKSRNDLDAKPQCVTETSQAGDAEKVKRAIKKMKSLLSKMKSDGSRKNIQIWNLFQLATKSENYKMVERSRYFCQFKETKDYVKIKSRLQFLMRKKKCRVLFDLKRNEEYIIPRWDKSPTSK